VACGRDGPLAATQALRHLGSDWLTTPLTRRTLLHIGHILRTCRQAVGWRYPHLALFTIVFKAALLAYVWSNLMASHTEPKPRRSPGACPRPISLTEGHDWSRLGRIGLDGRPSPTVMEAEAMSDVERWIHFGGSCTVFDYGLLSSETARIQILLEAADSLAMLSINGRPIGQVFAKILRHHAMM